MRGSKVAIISQFSKNGCSAEAKPNSEMTRNRGKVVAYGDVYQFSFYIKIISTSESVVGDLWVTHGICESREAK